MKVVARGHVWSSHQFKNSHRAGRSFSAALLALVVFGVAQTASVAHAENVADHGTASLVLQCANRCDAIASKIESLGGTVNLRYRNVNALAIKVPSAAVGRITNIAGVSGLGKDRLIAIPYPFAPLAINQAGVIDSGTINAIELGELLDRNPANYNFNLCGFNSPQLAANIVIPA